MLICVVSYASTFLLLNDSENLIWCAESQTTETRKKVQRWLSLTKELLTDKDPESMEVARQRLRDFVLDNSLKTIQSLTNIDVSKSMHAELSDALDSLLQTLCMLEYQRWRYTFELLPAYDEGRWNTLDPEEMEGMFAEETGWIKASLFPQLCRIQEDDQGEVSSTRSHMYWQALISIQNMRRTVICKARVAVEPDDLSPTEDTEMAENVGGEAESGLKPPGSPSEEITVKISETIELEQDSNQTQDQVENPASQEDIDQPMDEASLSNSPRETGEESLKTPDRGYQKSSFLTRLMRSRRREFAAEVGQLSLERFADTSMCKRENQE